MIDIAGGVVVLLPIDRPLCVDVEEIASTAAIGFCIGNLFTGVFNDKRALRNIGIRKEPESGSRSGAAHDKEMFWFLF